MPLTTLTVSTLFALGTLLWGRGTVLASSIELFTFFVDLLGPWASSAFKLQTVHSPEA